jgi:hypothetical protein
MLEIFIVDHAAACCSTPFRLQHLPICLPTPGFHLFCFTPPSGSKSNFEHG